MIILPKQAKNAKKQVRIIRPSKANRAVRANYLAELSLQVDFLKAQTVNLSDFIESGATRQEIASRIATLSAQASERVKQMGPQVAKSFVSEADLQNKKAVERSIATALSVDFATIIDGANVAAQLDMAIATNAGLITKLATDHYADIAKAVLDNYRGIEQPDGMSLTKRLMKIGNISETRAKFIARDQTSKLTGDLNQIRQQENGIEEYIWRNAQDNRVVGNPSGRYPKGNFVHGNHWDREGKTYSWNNPPHDGHPGAAPNCRCYSAPKLDLEKIKAQYI